MTILQIFDRFGASGFALLWLSFWESIAIGWGYGGDKYLRDIGRMCQNVRKSSKCDNYRNSKGFSNNDNSMALLQIGQTLKTA